MTIRLANSKFPFDPGTGAISVEPEALVPHLEIDLLQGLERKELRLRADQLDELARLNRKRAGDGERITENTLIRVAVDMLLSRADRLHGVSEDELRKSVTS